MLLNDYPLSELIRQELAPKYSNALQPQIDRWIKEGKRRIGFLGSGFAAKRLIEVVNLDGLEIVGFFDVGEPVGGEINGYPIHFRDDITSIKPDVMIPIRDEWDDEDIYTDEQAGKYLKITYKDEIEVFIIPRSIKLELGLIFRIARKNIKKRFFSDDKKGMNILHIAFGHASTFIQTLTKAINEYTEHSSHFVLKRGFPYFFNTFTDVSTCYEYEQEYLRKTDFQDIYELAEKADVFCFYMAENEESSFGPIKWKDFVKGKKVLYTFLGGVNEDKNLCALRHGSKVLCGLPEIYMRFFPSVDIEVMPGTVLLGEEGYLPRQKYSEIDGVIRILHTPSSMKRDIPLHKDVDIFKEVGLRLKERYGSKIEVLQITGKHHTEVMEIKKRCDIHFDHLRGHFDIAALEASAMAVPTILHLGPQQLEIYRRFYGDVEFPWVNATKDTLYETFVDLIEDKEKRVMIGQKSMAFFHRHFHPKQVAESFIKKYKEAPEYLNG